MANIASDELLQAEADLMRYSFGFLKSMALHSAVKLGIADALHRCGGSASLPDLLATLPIPPSKQPFFSRLMKLLAMEGIFVAEDVPVVDGEGVTCMYHLNTMSRLLVSDTGVQQSSCILMVTMPQVIGSALQLGQWFQSDGEATPFVMANGSSPYAFAAHHPEFNSVFNQAMAADSRYLADLVVRECADMFKGITSLVDVAGGTGTMARAIANVFPSIKCSVLDLPHVIEGISAQENVEFIAGDMMEFIPPADRILLKYVLHNWSDEDCVKILTRCREAVIHGTKPGKVIIIDQVVGGSPSKNILEAQLLMDMQMITLFMAKERYEQDWSKIFMEAGFINYKIYPILGVRSVIELYI